ncbi:competence protein ComK [Lentilactobacillus parabuchneri]|jgi:hypothetical protein|uniref:competence protein ComK n=1 Tax=Lentilactobacillus parabuchneri TaxID=152331 RepID=UPI00070DE930|nr:competence protein ComK [Lentilactobacillus parabuchneri]APR06624.1 hypothetical protein FAM21731_00408 [Lentilactobacillus parabuchneri]MBW0223868.1 competence protein ComK [Lentilactobacillus parabuchneri]MBW0246821.1 competence protein ComK [Lentilactobacillus parabuchneri]MBW0264699.1 competence protein ComK [Lentilactobacillus parabuchneri]MCT2884381.1 hypothetical protein [Lentilactobacillus parabuchneri]
MNYVNYLTSVGKRVHGDILHIDDLVESHIQKQAKSVDIHWRNVDALVAIQGSRIRTAILDCKLGIIGVQETPIRLLKQMLNQYPVLSYRKLKLINGYLEINEYKPFVYGGVGFAPLKATKGKNSSWISTTNIQDHAEMDHTDTMHISFDNCSSPIEVKISEYFLKKRKRAVSQVQRFHDAMHAQYEVASTEEYQNAYTHYKYGMFPEDPMAFELYALKETIRKTLEMLDYTYTDEMLLELMRKHMS